MSEQIYDGGPAFPGSYPGLDPRNPGWTGGGMTMRDYFAARAMKEVMRQFYEMDADGEIDDAPVTRRALATEAYQWADAMLAAREAAK